MTLADRFAWQPFKSVYRQRFGLQVPDWAKAMEMT